MRKALLGAVAALLTFHSFAFAQPSPLTSTCVLGGQPLACQYRFRADGGLDAMTVTVTLLTAAGAPVVGWPTICTLAPNAGTLAFCSCCPAFQAIPTGPGGVVVYTWKKIGGRGTLDVAVATGPVGWTLPISFTSPDQTGSCELAPASSTTILDFALFAACLPPGPYCVTSDFNCSGAVNLVDLGMLAGGLGKGCGPPCP